MSQINLKQRKLLEKMRQKDKTYRSIESCGDEIIIPARSGNIRALIYKPQSASNKIPVFFNLHGGGFVRGCPEKEDIFCKKLSEILGIAVINVDYRLAPEFPFPQGLNDAYDTVKYVHKNLIKFGIDPDRMAIGGHSAGGNLSTAVCMMAKKYGDFNLKCQILDYPALDLYTDAFKKPQLKEAIPPEIAQMFNLCYRKDNESRLSFASPVFAEKQELEDLPPALVITAQLDSLKDEAKTYADMLKQAGVIAEYHNYENVSHGFTISAFSPLGETVDDNTKDAANDVLAKTINFLRKHLF